MDVAGVSLHVSPPVQSQTESPTEPTVDETPQDQPQTGETTETTGEIDGVIRNLLAGHFKGVAAVRLHINHFEQLALIESENLKAAAQEQIANVLDAVGSGVDNLPGSTELLAAQGASRDETETDTDTDTLAELQQQFDDTVNQQNGEFQAAQTPSADDLIAGIENAFADFIGALQDLLVPPPQDDPEPDEEILTTTNQTRQPDTLEVATLIGGEPTETDPPPITDPQPAGAEAPADDEPQTTEPTGPDYQTLLDEIASAFADTIDELTEALDAALITPQLSQPNGNGTAYEKFLAVYNELWGIDAEQPNTESSQNVDMTA